MTAMQAAFSKVGFQKRDFTLAMAIKAFMLAGGKRADIDRIADMIFKESADQSGDENQEIIVGSEEGADQFEIGKTGRTMSASSSTDPVRERTDHGRCDDHRQFVRASRGAYARRTDEEKVAAKAAAITTAKAMARVKIGHRFLDKFSFHECAAEHDKYVQDAAKNLLRGVEQVEKAIIFELVLDHCVPVSPHTLVGDMIQARKLAEFQKRAIRLAPERIKLGIERAQEAFAQKELAS